MTHVEWVGGHADGMVIDVPQPVVDEGHLRVNIRRDSPDGASGLDFLVPIRKRDRPRVGRPLYVLVWGERRDP